MNKEELKQCIINWEEGTAGSMVDHFNYFDLKPANGGGGQHRRMPCLILTDTQLSTLFNSKKHIVNLAISLGLQIHKKQSVFCPVIECFYDQGDPEITAFTFDSHAASQSTLRRSYTDSRIPELLAHTLCRNWLQLENNQLLTVFNRITSDQTERVLSYKFRNEPVKVGESENHRLLSFMNNHLGNIKEFCFYLGVDLNKAGHRNQFSFSPVIEVKTNGQLSDDEVIRLHREGTMTYYSKSDDSELVFFEYISPCPATC